MHRRSAVLGLVRHKGPSRREPALIAARESAKKNGATQTKKPKRRTTTTVAVTAASRSGAVRPST
ncbi:hypothetical protein AB0O74_31195 [Streptomyces rubiginosohelvolus]|uniref:hypothetical protein n=1 Tax=Streptomyces rubiginosohelvolus TaxID=67362 RepID=UPI00341B5D1A